MSVEEAVMQLDVIEQDFIIFHNTDSKQINLVYRKKDGSLGVVEPQI
jgi:putative sigma-54 modulation protein